MPELEVDAAALGAALLGVGYPVSVGVLTRLLPVLRQRRQGWFLVLEGATACVAAGWLLRGRPEPAVLNAAALVGFAVLWRLTSPG